jgi:hypothetical protein
LAPDSTAIETGGGTSDLAHANFDPIHELLVGCDALTGPALGSQSTLSRFENVVGRTALTRVAAALADTVIGAIARRPGTQSHISLGIDDLHRVDDLSTPSNRPRSRPPMFFSITMRRTNFLSPGTAHVTTSGQILNGRDG